MSRLEELINKLCPAGVEYKTLNEVTKWDKKFKNINNNFYKSFNHVSAAKLKDLKNDNGTVKLLSTGNFDGVALKEDTMEYLNDDEVFTIPSGGSANIKYFKGEFVDSGNIIGTSLNSELYNTKYIYYFLENNNENIQSYFRGSGVKHPDMSAILNIKIAIPPLEIQCEIVEILDVFQRNIELNEKKYNESKKQIEWIKFHYLKNIDNAEIKTLGECCSVKKGKTPIQKAVPGTYPLVVTTSERKSCDTYQFETPSVCVPLVSSRGHGVASLNQVFYQEGKYGLGNILCAVIPNDSDFINTKYLYYYLNFFKDTKIVSLMKGGANVALTMDSLKTVTVEVPPIKKQFEIMQKLEMCDKLSNSLMNKIILVKKQYKYYRELLLDFKEVEVNE